MQVREIRLRNTKGLHARVAAKIVKVAGRFRSRIVLHVGERKASARSIMAVLMLAAAMGATVRVEIEGPDEVAALEAVASVLGAGSDRA
jgi:phosphocarrier protein